MRFLQQYHRDVDTMVFVANEELFTNDGGVDRASMERKFENKGYNVTLVADCIHIITDKNTNIMDVVSISNVRTTFHERMAKEHKSLLGELTRLGVPEGIIWHINGVVSGLSVYNPDPGKTQNTGENVTEPPA